MIKFDEEEYRGNLTKQIAAINKGYEYAKEITADGYSNIFFVAVGGTMAMMLHFAAIAKQKTKIPVYVEQAAELVVAGNTQLNKDSLVIMGSKSGDTKETVAAAKWCKERGIRIASMVIDKESPLGQLTDYQLPLVVFKGVEYVYLSMLGLFYGLLNCNGDFPEYDQFVEALAKLPDTLVDAQKKFDEPADAIAKKYFNADYMMWIGSGELWGEVYLFSMCILEEMQWIRTKSITSPEFFHGTLELVEKDMPVFLVKSAGVYRTLDERAEKFLKEHTDNLIVIDVMDYMIPGLKPEFAPLVAPIISTAVLNGRLSKHIESYTGHDLDMRRYYRQFEY